MSRTPTSACAGVSGASGSGFQSRHAALPPKSASHLGHQCVEGIPRSRSPAHQHLQTEPFGSGPQQPQLARAGLRRERDSLFEPMGRFGPGAAVTVRAPELVRIGRRIHEVAAFSRTSMPPNSKAPPRWAARNTVAHSPAR